MKTLFFTYMIQYLDVRTRPFIICKGNDCLLPDLHCWKSHIFLSLTDACHGQWTAKVLVFANQQSAYHKCHLSIVNCQVDIDASWTPSRGDIIGQLGRKQAAFFWGENFCPGTESSLCGRSNFQRGEEQPALHSLVISGTLCQSFVHPRLNPCLT